MKVWTVTNFPGYYPVGFCATITAEDTEQAKHLFEIAVEAEGLDLTDDRGNKIDYTMQLLDISTANCVIHVNGNY